MILLRLFILLVKLCMFVAAIGLVIDPDDRRFGYMNAAVAALAHGLVFRRREALGFGVGTEKAFEQPHQDCNDNQ
jgi:hypothetical protein